MSAVIMGKKTLAEGGLGTIHVIMHCLIPGWVVYKVGTTDGERGGPMMDLRAIPESEIGSVQIFYPDIAEASRRAYMKSQEYLQQ